jgi:hypothetical protein
MEKSNKMKAIKTTPIAQLTRLTIATAVFAGSAGIVIAGETTTAKQAVAQVISLHAPNNATQTVTIWTPRAIPPSAGDTVAARNSTAKVVELHAPNSITQSATIWMRGMEKKSGVAPLK